MEKGVTKEEAKKNAPAKNVDEYIASAQKKNIKKPLRIFVGKIVSIYYFVK